MSALKCVCVCIDACGWDGIELVLGQTRSGQVRLAGGPSFIGKKGTNGMYRCREKLSS